MTKQEFKKVIAILTKTYDDINKDREERLLLQEENDFLTETIENLIFYKDQIVEKS